MRRASATDGPAGAVVGALRRRVATAVVLFATADRLAPRLTAALVTGGARAAGLAVVRARRQRVARILRGAKVLLHAAGAIAGGSLGAFAALETIPGRREVGAQNLAEWAVVARIALARVDVDALPIRRAALLLGPRRAVTARCDTVIVRARNLRVASSVLDEARVEAAPAGSDAVARGARRALAALEAVGARGWLEVLAEHPGVARTLGAGVEVHASGRAVTDVPSRARAADGPSGAVVGAGRQLVAPAVLDRAAGSLDALGVAAALVTRGARTARETSGAVDALGELVAAAVRLFALVDVLALARLCGHKSIRAVAALVPADGVDALNPRVASPVVHSALVHVGTRDAVVRRRVPGGALAAHHAG